MKSKYKESERIKAVKLIQENQPVFYGAKGGKYFLKSKRDFVLIDNLKNIFEPIRNDVVRYFKENNISWWGGKKPTGHVLSSQIACINYLFTLRNDKVTVLQVLKTISLDFVEVLEINTDRCNSGYIQFEAVSDQDYLNESLPRRGSNCTSIDALIYALHKDNSRWLIPIEWKYVECYNNQNKAIEGKRKDPINYKGKERKRRYSNLINQSNQLIGTEHSCYYYEPFYQLMRQTLWAEQMVKNKEKETLKADNYLHIHVIPNENIDLLDKIYNCSGLKMEETWRKHLKDQSKYRIINPEQLLSNIDSTKYKDLLNYLSARYWSN